MITIAHASSEEEAERLTTALAAFGIVSRAQRVGARWEVAVRRLDVPKAKAVVDDLAKEEAPLPRESHARWPRVGLAVAALLVGAHAWAVWRGHEGVVVRAGCSGYLLAKGEVYRCVTSLFVHADLEHLLSNAIALAVMISGVAAGTGSGLGILLVLLAGSLGNAVSSAARSSYRLSIGASTAVFASIGILAARQCFAQLRVPAGRLWALVPLGAALSLLGMLGAGPRTDLSAHLFGLVAGMAVGAIAALCCARPGPMVQVGAGALTTALAAAAWQFALAR